ncbi:MAG: dockerin type I domain-containing protein [Planctomycetota bacterium]
MTITNSDPSELVLESEVVTFDVGVDSISVPITAVDDDLVDGSQFVTLTATADGVLEGSATVEVVDFETLDLQLSANSLFENGDTIELTIVRQDLSSDATVVLEVSRNDKLSLESETVTLPVGVAEATITLTGVDNQILDGTQPVQLSVSSEHYIGSTVDVEVLDYEPLLIVIDETEISEKDGVATVVLSRPDTSFPLTVQLDVSPAGIVTSPTIIEFGIGVNEASFTIDAIDNSTVDEFRLVSVTATAPDHVPAEVGITVLDHEELEFVLPVTSVAENAGVLQGQLRRSDPNGDAVASLFSAAPTRLQLPPSVTFSDGNELSDPFDVILRDNTLPDGSTTVALTATMFGYQLALAELEVTDFEPLELTQLGGDVSEGAGEVLFRLTRPTPVFDAEILLDGGVERVFELPDSVRFEAGETEVTFAGTVIDDEFVRANPSITVTAGSSTYVADSVTFEVIENDIPELTLELNEDSLLEGTDTVSARLSRNTATELNAVITTDIPGILDVPASLEFPEGRVFVDFEIGTIDDAVVSGAREVNLTINGIGHPIVTAPVTVADDEIPGFEFTGESIELTEDGVEQMIGLRLLTEPATEVTVNLAISDTSQVNMTPTQLVFSPSNWNIAQNVVVDPIDDDTVEPSQTFSIVASVSSNGPYAGLEDLSVPVVLQDDDVPMILLEETDGSTIVDELGLNDSFTVRLGSRPQSDVLVVIDGSEVAEAVFLPPELTFTPDNWDQEQVITVSTPLDFEVDRNQIGSVYVNVDPVRSDPAYASAGQRIFALVQLDSVLNDLRVRTDNDQLVLVDEVSGQVLRSSPLSEPGGATVTLGDRSEAVFVEALSSDDVLINTDGGDDKISFETMAGGSVDGGDGLDVVALLAAGELPMESAGGIRLRNIEHIDLSDSDRQVLSLDPQRVQAITDELNTLTLTVGPEDTLSLSSTWAIGAPVLSEGIPTHTLTSDGVTIQLANSSIWQNPLDPFDIDRSGSASPSDALAAINRLAVQDDGTLPFFPPSPDQHYFDVNGDGEATVRDALAIINHLAGLTNQSGLEGEATDVLRVEEVESEAPVDLSPSTLDEAGDDAASQWDAESVDQAVDEMTQSDWLSEGEAESEDQPVYGPIWSPLI